MPYDVVKKIRGNEYRYRVRSFRDSETKRVRQTWTYLGAGSDAAQEARRRSDETRARIIAAILKLLDKRDITHLTVAVISRTAQVSRGTFYRQFASKTAALASAFEVAFAKMRSEPQELLTGPIQSVSEERERLRKWIEAILRNSVRSPGVQVAMSSSRDLHKARRRYSEQNHEAVHSILIDYLRRLQTAGLLDASSFDVLAEGIQCVLSGIFKRLVFDREVGLEDGLIAAGTDLVCRALFGR